MSTRNKYFCPKPNHLQRVMWSEEKHTFRVLCFSILKYCPENCLYWHTQGWDWPTLARSSHMLDWRGAGGPKLIFPFSFADWFIKFRISTLSFAPSHNFWLLLDAEIQREREPGGVTDISLVYIACEISKHSASFNKIIIEIRMNYIYDQLNKASLKVN